MEKAVDQFRKAAAAGRGGATYRALHEELCASSACVPIALALKCMPLKFTALDKTLPFAESKDIPFDILRVLHTYWGEEKKHEGSDRTSAHFPPLPAV